MTIGLNSFTTCVLKVRLAPVSVLRPLLLLPSQTERRVNASFKSLPFGYHRKAVVSFGPG